eukprot:Blabericola_migrator_1__1385@NODE_135_length_13182_cov_103_341289_g117_i0_p2_GENE_NODE_135_length_13182_cov_103_341289_g117_i0NODE_135_length_13182_cov_103_341289_g117_i0_p2_ORF_typecomplete_len1137_score148_67DUF726/PF05277_12/1_3e74DUF900/PF05990_12/8_4e08Abhydrolase_8/PF06259_12/0_00013Cutinase/PF01083_22/0_00098DUF676/PF05057_14/0_0011LCAT/PF02450_15/0_0064DUF915/PF06028_11/0_0055PGAP1/PF07819_13/0_016VirJ/PF06057_11/0_016Hydrolase_4/PF12146_8/0_038Thioesterase/PF00975_20/0_056PEPPE/PF08237_
MSPKGSESARDREAKYHVFPPTASALPSSSSGGDDLSVVSGGITGSDRMSETSSVSRRPASSRPPPSGVSPVEAADFGKLRQKTKHKQFELRQAVQRNRLEAIRTRRKGLATISLFTFVSIHKMEQSILDAASPVVKEALFVLFFHQLVMKCEEVLRLLRGSSNERIPQRQIPTFGDNLQDPTTGVSTLSVESTPKASTHRSPTVITHSPCSSDLDMGDPRATVHPESTANNMSLLKPIQPKGPSKKTKKIDSKLIYSWARGVARAYATALKIGDDPAVVSLIRNLDRYVNQLIDPCAELVSSGASNPMFKQLSRQKGYGSIYPRQQPTQVNPLVYNPQPAKRCIVTFSNIVQARVMDAISDCVSARHQPPIMVRVPSDPSLIVSDPTPVEHSSAQRLGSIFNKFTQHRSPESQSSVESHTSRRSFLRRDLSPDELAFITDPEYLQGTLADSTRFIEEIAERFSLLPGALTSVMIRCIEEEESAVGDGSKSGVAPVGSRSAPILDYDTPSFLGESPTDPIPSHPVSADDQGDMFGTAACPFDDELVPWMPDDDFLNLPASVSITPMSQASEEQGVKQKVEPNALLLQPPAPLSPQMVEVAYTDYDNRPRSVPVIDVKECQGAHQFFHFVPFHLMVFWESLYGVLKAGYWDSLLGEVFGACAESLDIQEYLFDLLLSYTADLVAEQDLAAHEVPRNTHHQHPSRNGVRPATVAASRTSTTSSRSLATTSTHQLRMSRAISRAKLFKIAGVALGVGALSAVTAGIAAPAFAAGFGALGIAGTSGITTFLGSAGGSAALASLFGASSASLSGWKFSRRLADIKVFEFVHLCSNYVIDGVAGYTSEMMELHHAGKSESRPRASLGIAHLSSISPPRKLQPPFNIVIGISGWLNSVEDATKPWLCLADKLGTDLFALKWEPQLLTELGFMIIRILGENVASSAASVALQMTMTASGTFIMWPVSMLQYAAQLDNTWITCRHRAQQAGVLLAAALSDRSLVGNRPVSLVGYSMGSRVITYCLKELHRRGQFNRVQDVVLMGLPGSKQRETWRKMRSVVCGRLINVYCSTDWILAFLYRWMEWGVKVAGLGPVEGVPGVENVDATGIVISHNHYERRIPEILAYCKLHSSFAHLIEIPYPPPE